MPVAFELDDARRIVESRAWGDLNETDMFWHVARMRELFANGTLDASWSQIADFSEVTNFAGLSGDGVRRLAEDNPWPAGARRVFVAPSTEIYGLVRMYQTLTDADIENVSVVTTRAEALKLLEERPRDVESRI